MSTELERFRDHCREMAAGGHSDECKQAHEQARQRWGHFMLFREWPEKWGERPSRSPQPCPGGCVSEVDQALFARLAAEVDDYLTSDEDEGLFA